MAFKAPSVCPVCDADVPRNAKACPECGACEKTGWNEEGTAADGLDLPDNDFDYDKFMEEEFGVPRRRSTWQWIVAGTAVLLVVGFLLVLFHH